MKDSIKTKTIAVLISLLLFSGSALSSTNSDLQSFFNGLGYSNNVTNPNAYKGQAASYYNAGSLYVKSNIRNAQLISVTTPSVSAGCGGIDTFFGAFSHVSSDQLVATGKAIIQNATPFAVDLALQTWAPQIKVVMDKIQAIADKWLNQSINSCEAAQAMVGGLTAFAGNETKKHVCSTLGTQTNAFADWVAARHECGAMGETPTMMESARNDPAYEDMTRTNHNIVWDALLKNSFLSADKQLAEFFMTLSGTYIYDASGNPKILPSLFTDNNNMVNAMLSGGDMTVYDCDNDAAKQCINPTTTTLTISTSNGFDERIYKIINDIYEQLNNDTALTDTQKSFIEYTSMPMLSILISYRKQNTAPPFALYSRVLSAEILNRYLTDALAVIRDSLRLSLNDPDDIEKIERSIAQARNNIEIYQAKVGADLTDYENRMIVHQEVDKVSDRKLSKKMQSLLSFGWE